MAPELRSGRKTLSYPLWALDFDPLNHDFLLVGGGGGSTSSGVPNKITLIDASRKGDLSEVVDLELAKNEDSVVSLAISDSNSKSLTAYAGINSSVEDQKNGKNEHLRSFRIGLPTRKRSADGEEKPSDAKPPTPLKSEALARASLFRSVKGGPYETYQRKLRIAPAHRNGGPRIGAVASGLAAQNEVITFRTTTSSGSSSVISRVNLESAEASDLDIIPVGDTQKSSVLAYCTDYEVFLQRIPGDGKEVKEPKKVNSSANTAADSKIKCARWLNTRYLVLLRNRPKSEGSEIEVLKTDKDYTQAQVVLVSRLNKATKSAVGLDVCALSEASSGEQQFVVAVVGQDCSIEILTTGYTPNAGLTKLKSYTRLREVQPGPITGVAFSTFTPPSMPVSEGARLQYIRLASISATNVVVVHTLPLRPYPATSKTPRYLLVPPSETVQKATDLFVAFLVIGIVAFCLQVFCELRGLVPVRLHAQSWVSPTWQHLLTRPYVFSNKGGPVIPESMPPVIQSSASSVFNDAAESLRSAGEAASTIANQANEATSNFLANLVSSDESNDKAIVIRDDTHNPENTLDLATELHDADSSALDKLKAETVKKWDDLTHEEKKGWKRKLIDAGHWTEKEGEKILKGIFFGELAGVVGAAMGG